jgi:TfoX/Sxy family transcriptional regulator of competence genes
MAELASDPDALFAVLVDAFADRPGVTPPAEGDSRFGSAALQVNGAIFAMVTRGRLVVKLPSRRVAALVDAGTGVPFDANRGLPMKQWLTVVGTDPATWHALAEEAYAFVAQRH